MLYATTSNEVREKDITGRYLIPYGFVNNAPDKAAAGCLRLARELWRKSVEICRKHVPGFKIPESILD